MPGLRRIRAAEVVIETAAPAQTDGEDRAAGTGPFTVRDAARPIAIVVSG